MNILSKEIVGPWPLSVFLAGLIASFGNLFSCCKTPACALLFCLSTSITWHRATPLLCRSFMGSRLAHSSVQGYVWPMAMCWLPGETPGHGGQMHTTDTALAISSAGKSSMASSSALTVSHSNGHKCSDFSFRWLANDDLCNPPCSGSPLLGWVTTAWHSAPLGLTTGAQCPA